MIRWRLFLLSITASLAAGAFATVPTTRAQNLVANPVLLRDLPPPGWIADRRAEWLAQHPVYQSACRSVDVGKEIEFLHRLVARDEFMVTAAGKSDMGDPAMARQAALARQNLGLLRADLAAIDQLTAQLEALPACSQTPAAPTAPMPAATPAAAQTAPAPAAPSEPSPPAPEERKSAAAPPPDAAQTVTLRFDDRVFGLTPLSIRAFNKAADAIRAGRKVRLAIDGCGADADLSADSPCGKRFRFLKKLLAENDIRDTQGVLPDLP